MATQAVIPAAGQPMQTGISTLPNLSGYRPSIPLVTTLLDSTTLATVAQVSPSEISGKSVSFTSELKTDSLLSMRGWLLKRKKGCAVPAPSKLLYHINRSSFTFILGDFNKRFFWLDPTIRLIYYSESEDRSKRVSFIPFNKVVSVQPVIDPIAINTAKPGWVYGIELHTVDRIYELWAKSSGESKQWLAVLEKAAAVGRRSTPTSQSFFDRPSSICSSAQGFVDIGTTQAVCQANGPFNGVLSRRGSAVGQENTLPAVMTATAPLSPPGKQEELTDFASLTPSTKKQLFPQKWDDWTTR